MGGHCRANDLPTWPTVASMSKAGLINEQDTFTLVFNCIVCACGFLPFLLQSIEFIQNRSVHGVSMAMIVLQLMTTVLQAGAIFDGEALYLYVCPSLSSMACFQNTLDVTTLWVQAAGTVYVFLTYMYYLRMETDVHTSEIMDLDPFMSAVAGLNPNASFHSAREANPLLSRLQWIVNKAVHFSWLAFIATLGLLSMCVVLPFFIGPCAYAVYEMNFGVTIVACLMQAMVGLPQIILLVKLKDHGTLSIPAVVIQAVGSAMVAVSFITQNALVLNILAFIVVTAEMTFILVLAGFFAWRKRQRRRNGEIDCG